MPVGQPIPDSTFCRRFIESVTMMASAIFAAYREASHCMCDCFYLHDQTGGRDSVGSTVLVYSPSTLLDRESPTRLVLCDWASTRICTSALAFPPGHLRQCAPRFSDSRVLQLGLSSAGRFSQSLACLSSARPHTCWIDCSAWTIHDLPLASLHPFTSMTAPWSGF